MTELKYRGAQTIYYRKADLSNLQYIKVIYTDMDGEPHEVKTEINYLSDDYLSLFVKKTKKSQKEEEDDINVSWEGEEEIEEAANTYYTDYYKKIAEIKEAKEKAEVTGVFDEYYKKLEEIKQASEEEKYSKKPKEPENQEEIQEEVEEETNRAFDIDCPQEVILKFIIDDLLYTAKGTMKNVDIKPSKVYFKITAPPILELQQHRRFYRIDLKRLCLMVATDKNGSSDAYVARSINLSAGGVLINRLESIAGNKFITLDPQKYEKYNLILVLEMDKILKLSARYVRQEEGKLSYRYAFEFIDIPESKTNYISKYVIRKQIEELRVKHDIKYKISNKPIN